MADSVHVAASFSTQANALLRKNLTFQVFFPVFFINWVYLPSAIQVQNILLASFQFIYLVRTDFKKTNNNFEFRDLKYRECIKMFEITELSKKKGDSFLMGLK